jgi:hypothetical protein
MAVLAADVAPFRLDIPAEVAAEMRINSGASHA